MRFRIISMVLIFSIIFAPFSADARDWVDNWFDHAVANVSGPSSVNFSARNYYGAGGASLRWQTGTLYPVSISPPKISFGCGGVDIFLGSLGLLDFDHLVSRSKTIMYAAAAFAFKYALAKMNPKAAQILDALQATVNFLNQLQLNECQAGKAIAAVMMTPFSKEAAHDFGRIKNNLGSLFGSSDSWEKMVEAWKGGLKPGEGSSSVSTSFLQKANEGCSVDITNMFDSGGDGTFLGKLTKDGVIPSTQFLTIIRSLIGDIKLSASSTIISIIPCYLTGNDPVKDFLNNNLNTCSSISGNKCICRAGGIGAGEIKNSVKRAIENYYVSVVDRSRTTDETRNILSKLYGFPAYDFLLMAYKSRIPSAIIQKESALVECASYYYVAGLLMNILHIAENSISQLPDFYKAACSKAKDIEKCQFCNSNNQRAIAWHVNMFKKRIFEFISNYLNKNQKEMESCLSLQKVQTVLLQIDREQKLLSGGVF